VNSSGEVVVIEETEVSTGPHAGSGVEDPFFQSESFRTPTHTVGTSGFGSVPLTVCDLYGNLGVNPDQPMASQVPETSVSYTVPLNHFTGMTSNVITVADQLLIGSHSNPSIQMAHSTMVLHVATIPTGNVTPSQALIGTPLRPNPSVPLGYRALNPSITNTTQVTPGGSIPTPLFGGTGLGGSNLAGASGHSFSGFQIPLGTQPHAGGKPPFGSQTQMGTQSQLGGQSQTGIPNLSYGQNVTPNPWHIPFSGNPLFPGGKHPQGKQQPYPPYGKNVYPPYGKTQQPTYNPQNPSGYPPYPHVSQPSSNPVYSGQPQPNVGGPTGYNYPPNPVYGPTGVPMPHQYHPHVNRQLPFLATLDLPDLSRLTNDPILHYPFWPVIPAKLPSDIPKFDGKPGEDPNNHVMTFHLWCSSNSLMDDSIRLRLFQRTLTGSATKWYIELPRGSFQDFNSLAMSFLTHFQLPIRYEMGTELLTSLHQTNSMHISDHIHEWR
jgi:hypothetical protein